ncbi:hypothetical protein A9P82_11315 [Arachidicoccus ginsenosidimutans]|uniref:glycosyltransferase n=1 Tax=Arachidicoccus sp. BS20 TaxID=1850526 RepID=UPI0007F18392|nr:glycosyltransferase [Arachidicoccus sp. BS20]ANI89827.1 hypothetical protein A9P82_11315 [Arachidicoccus sp. BS20]
MNEKPLIVISAVRYFRGGTIVIVDDCLEYVSKHLSQIYRIKVLVYQKEKFIHHDEIEFVEFPKARHSLFFRLYYEYFLFKKLSAKWKPKLWLSLQDTTPNVTAEIQAVYFHNPLLILKKLRKTVTIQPRLIGIWFLYKTIYKSGITKNKYVVVQQKQWQDVLQKTYHLSASKLLIFPPKISPYPVEKTETSIYTFIFSATALAHKNFKIVCEACMLLNKKTDLYKVLLVISGTENKYINKLKKQYKLPQLQFKKFSGRSDLFQYYNQSNCMIFPSLLETWGLPLSEFAMQNKPIICANLPYAKETLANYEKVKFFNPYDAQELENYMFAAINDKLSFDKNPFQYSQPVIQNWEELFSKLLTE